VSDRARVGRALPEVRCGAVLGRPRPVPRWLVRRPRPGDRAPHPCGAAPALARRPRRPDCPRHLPGHAAPAVAPPRLRGR